MITQYFADKLKQTPVAEVTNGQYSMWDDGSAEIEVLEFLYSMVRLIKPTHILETGTYLGWSAAYMAQGVKENGFGSVETVEFDPNRYKVADLRWQDLGLRDLIQLHAMKAAELEPKFKYQLVLLDTEMHLRLGELVRLFPFLEEGGYVFLHDFPFNLCQGNTNPDHPGYENWPVGAIPQQLTDWVKDGKLRPMFFPNGRGMLAFYKPRADEHKWL